MAQIPKISYIEPTELREHIELIKEDKDGAKTIAVIDVRDEDFEGGMLPFARNVPSEEWYNDDLIDQLVAQFRSKDMVVFHCMQSQQRGPFCARRFLARLTVALEGAEGTSFPDIRVLRGGFGTWRAMYGSDKTLVVPITSSNT